MVVAGESSAGSCGVAVEDQIAAATAERFAETSERVTALQRYDNAILEGGKPLQKIVIPISVLCVIVASCLSFVSVWRPVCPLCHRPVCPSCHRPVCPSCHCPVCPSLRPVCPSCHRPVCPSYHCGVLSVHRVIVLSVHRCVLCPLCHRPVCRRWRLTR